MNEISKDNSTFEGKLVNGGSQTLNWPSSINFPSGVVPTLTMSGTDITVLIMFDDGRHTVVQEAN